MSKLFVQVYLTVLGVVVLFALSLPLLALLLPIEEAHQKTLDGVANLLASQLPADGDENELERSVERLSEQLGLHLSVRDQHGTLLASVRAEPYSIDPARLEKRWLRSGRGKGAASLRLPDGRWLLISPDRRARHHGGFLLSVAALCGIAAVGAWPLVRRITRRLETLTQQVDELGSGDLSARVEVKGSDEVAELARSFNRAADRIERLVSAQRNTLAGASHELRSPLARMRVAVELMADEGRQELRDQVASDISELDELIDELLLASRLDTAIEMEQPESIDLLALLAEEAARIEAEVSGDNAVIEGNARMLRRLFRNLLENAQRHGDPASIHASIASLATGGVQIRVTDAGPGVAEAERERIFEPFYRAAGIREGGVGLGLALVRRIAEHHGGNARCLPREGGGTCFQVEFGPQPSG
jgi:two-component system OmpR family sensor kinase